MQTTKAIICAALLVAALCANAQEKKTTFGVKAGLNISDISSADDQEFNNTSSKTGFHAGVTLDYAFTSVWYLFTGLEYTTKGTKIELSGGEFDITAAYVQLPIGAGAKIAIPAKTWAILCQLGPYFAYGLHGKSKYGTHEWDTFSKEIAKNFDCGILFGAGIEWKKLCLMLGGEAGLVNIMQEGNSKSENANFTLSVGYKF